LSQEGDSPAQTILQADWIACPATLEHLVICELENLLICAKYVDTRLSSLYAEDVVYIHLNFGSNHEA
jgi:hypothetical protein